MTRYHLHSSPKRGRLSSLPVGLQFGLARFFKRISSRRFSSEARVPARSSQHGQNLFASMYVNESLTVCCEYHVEGSQPFEGCVTFVTMKDESCQCMAWTRFQLLLDFTFPLLKKGHWRYDQSSFAYPVC